MTCNDHRGTVEAFAQWSRHFSRVANQGCGVGSIGDGFDVVFENFEDRQIAEFRVRI